MTFNRTSSAASLLVVLACGMVVAPPLAPSGPESHRELSGIAAPAKSMQRLSFLSEGDAVAWLEKMAQQALAANGSKLDRRALEQAASKLDWAAIENLLGRFWNEEEESWWEKREQWEALKPLRRALLERLAVLDLPRSLQSYPHEARILLETGAHEDGTGALEAWLASREELAKAKWHPSIDNDLSQIIEGVREVPTISGMSLPQEARNRLMKGWAGSQPEQAWQAILTRTDLDYQHTGVLEGMIDGLGAGSAWAEWASRLDALDWSDPKTDHSASPNSGSGDLRELKATAEVTLVKRWIMDEPDAALRWLEEREVSWERDDQYFTVSSFNSGTTGSGGGGTAPLRILVYAAWLENRPTEAITRLADSGDENEAILTQLATWNQFPSRTSISAITAMKPGETKDRAALELAQSLILFQSHGNLESADLLGELGVVKGLGTKATEAIARMRTEQ